MDSHSPQTRLLALDDEEYIRHYYRHLLTRAGYQVQTAAHGEEALRYLEGQSFDLLLLDLRMPQMDGKAFLRRLGISRNARTCWWSLAMPPSRTPWRWRSWESTG